MERADVVIVGAGLLGCFAARALSAYDLRVIVLEQREDVCTGISRANTAIIYTGYDTKPGTLKTQLCTRASAGFEQLCRDLDVRFRRCGSLMVSFGPRAETVLEEKYRQGIRNGVPGLRLLDREEVLRQEPNLSPNVTRGLYAAGTGTVNPWELCIAAFENARANGVEFRFTQKVLRMVRQQSGFLLETGRERYFAGAVLNCAGLFADEIRELVETPLVRVIPNQAVYLVLDDKLDGFLHHVIFHEPEEKGKGLTLIPTVDGNLLIGPSEQPGGYKSSSATTKEGLEFLKALCTRVVPELPLDQVIRSFGTRRPNPFFVRMDSSGSCILEHTAISSFTILEENGLFSMMGIKTPGLTCAWELGRFVTQKITAYLHKNVRNPLYSPVRRSIVPVRTLPQAERARLVRCRPEYGEIVCRCRQVTKGEILDAIQRGATTVDGVKRRTGACMGRCQGGYCTQTILELLAQELQIAPEAVTKDGVGSNLLDGGNDGNL
ncbi:MAG: NAD(P)/FAD-dependent oxidoreductase [Lawsonibacter sp.]